MNFPFRFQPSLSAVKDRLPDWRGWLPAVGDISAVNHKMVVILEQVGVAILLAALTGLVERFVPFWVGGAWLVLVGGLVAFAVFEGLDTFDAPWLQRVTEYKTGIATYLAVSVCYFFLIQPAFVLLGELVIGLVAGGFAARFLRHSWWKALGGFVLATGLGTGVASGLSQVFLALVLPWAPSLTMWLWNLAPVLAQIPILAILGYCELREPSDRTSWYWLATPGLSVLYLAFFWPSHSILAMVVASLVAVLLSVYAYIGRRTPGAAEAADYDDEPANGFFGKVWKLAVFIGPRKHSHRGFYAAVVASVLFVGLFAVGNSWQWFYDYGMANAVTVNHRAEMPATYQSRLVPYTAAKDYCAQSNGVQFNTLQADAQPVVLTDGQGVRRFYWQCGRYPTRFLLDLGHMVYATGGLEGAVMVDAGERGKFGAPIQTTFVFSDLSKSVRGAFFWRHAGSQAQPAFVAPDTSGNDYLVVPYTSTVVQWGPMIPELSGVMVVSPWGFIEDYTPAQAARKFPGARFVPSTLARRYADLWGLHSSMYAKYGSGMLYEVSEFNKSSGNSYPFWQDFKEGVGLKGVINFEPMGREQNSTALIGLFDRASLEMDVVDVSHLDMPGPSQIISSLAVSHPGLYNATIVEPLYVVSDDHRIYYMVALMSPSRPDHHGYAANIVYNCHAQNPKDVTSGAEADAWIAQQDKTECK